MKNDAFRQGFNGIKNPNEAKMPVPQVNVNKPIVTNVIAKPIKTNPNGVAPLPTRLKRNLRTMNRGK